MSESKAPELKPCPFCGGLSRVISGHAAQSVWSHGKFYRVFCESCQSRQLFHRTEYEAIAAWKRRADLVEREIAERDAEIERLKQVNGAIALEFSRQIEALQLERQRARLPDIPSEKVLSAISESLFNASFLHGSSDVPTDIYEAILSAMGLDNG